MTSSSPPGRLLVADDDPVIRALILDQLAGGHHDVRGVGSVEAVLAALIDWQSDVVVLDLNLPDGDGLDLCRRLRRGRLRPLARHSGEPPAAEARRAGERRPTDPDGAKRRLSLHRRCNARVSGLPRRLGAALGSIAGRTVVILAVGLTLAVAGSLLIAEQVRLRDLDQLRRTGVVVTVATAFDGLRDRPADYDRAIAAGRMAGLKGIIDPVVEIAEAGAKCGDTGLPLIDIWRYFRHTWAHKYRSIPGRQMMVLIRNAARPLRPVIGGRHAGRPGHAVGGAGQMDRVASRRSWGACTLRGLGHG